MLIKTKNLLLTKEVDEVILTEYLQDSKVRVLHFLSDFTCPKSSSGKPSFPLYALDGNKGSDWLRYFIPNSLAAK